MGRLLLVLIDNGSKFDKTGAARMKAQSPSVEQLTNHYIVIIIMIILSFSCTYKFDIYILDFYN